MVRTVSPKCWANIVATASQTSSYPKTATSGCTSNRMKTSSTRASKQCTTSYHVLRQVIRRKLHLITKQNNVPLPSTAAYDDSECGETFSGPEGFVNSTFVSREKSDYVIKHNLQLDCMWVIEAKIGWKVRNAVEITPKIDHL